MPNHMTSVPRQANLGSGRFSIIEMSTKIQYEKRKGTLGNNFLESMDSIFTLDNETEQDEFTIPNSVFHIYSNIMPYRWTDVDAAPTDPSKQDKLLLVDEVSITGVGVENI
jgi:hypothetical protein